MQPGNTSLQCVTEVPTSGAAGHPRHDRGAASGSDRGEGRRRRPSYFRVTRPDEQPSAFMYRGVEGERGSPVQSILVSACVP